MTKNPVPTPPPSCGCENCLCRRGPRCHDYNALLALALWDFGRLVRRRMAK